MEDKGKCYHCGMDIWGKPVIRKIGERKLQFCCENCATLFEMKYGPPIHNS